MDNLFFVVHTHWDREWYEPFQRMRARLVAMTDKMLDLVEAGTLPYFHFDGQTIVLEDYLAIRPENGRRLRKLVKAGKIQIGPWYVLADSFLVSGESLIRNLELGFRKASRFGTPLQVGYLPDQFGHIAQMPQILTGFDLTTCVTWRGVGPDVRKSRFLWRAPDGSEVTTVYLPFGYSNGANLPLDSVDSFASRCIEIVRLEKPFANGLPILVMNGTDHAEPDSRLPEKIAALKERDTGVRIELGTLEQYVKRLSEVPLDAVERHDGELRSPLRAHLLPGVTSARNWIKQRDFQNCYLLERLCDPMAALAALNGDGESLLPYLELAWETEIQNHPHDSICGCSIDQVHQDMQFRFDQAGLLAEMVIRRASSALLRDGGADTKPGIAVFNPSFATEALVSGELEVEDPGASYVVEDKQGRRIPVAIKPLREERIFETAMPLSQFKGLVAGLTSAVLMGRTVNRYTLADHTPSPSGNRESRLDLFLTRSPTSKLDLTAFKRDLAEKLPENGTIQIRAVSAARAKIAFVARDLTQVGWTCFRLIYDPVLPRTVDSSEIPAQVTAETKIENEFYVVRPSEEGLEIRDLETAQTLELYIEDDGDRGDEYNYDPVSSHPPITHPADFSAKMLENNRAVQRLSLSMTYELPARLDAARDRRSSEIISLSVGLIATLYPGLRRIDLELEMDNRARDHRLRVGLRTPIRAAEALSDTSFGVVKRAVGGNVEPRGLEDIYPTFPQRIFTAVESDAFSAALMSRGLLEAEVRPNVRPNDSGSTILLTLLRCVGWLSRSDLATRRGGAGPELETPGAQEIGSHRFEFSVTTYKGGYLEAALVPRIHSYAFPPRAFGCGGHDADGISLGQCDNPSVVFSTARLNGGHARYKLRAYSVSTREEVANFKFFPASKFFTKSIRVVNLAGRRVANRSRRSSDGRIRIRFRPFEIVTLEVGEAAREKNFRETAQKD